MYSCEILADSIKKHKYNRITTFVLIYPRIVHSELLTHRMFSRNSASSRAIPVKTMIDTVKSNPFVPIEFQKPHRGMQGNNYLDGEEKINAKRFWLSVLNTTLYYVSANEDKITKQLLNRLIEPFLWHKVILTATEFDNFFNLRCPIYEIEGKRYKSKNDAVKDLKINLSDINWLEVNKSQTEIHLQYIAELMWDAYNLSVPKVLNVGEWHIPYNLNDMPIEQQIRVSTARCARISYETLGEVRTMDIGKDMALHDRLLADGHFSPFEHIARAAEEDIFFDNFKGWKSYRHILQK